MDSNRATAGGLIGAINGGHISVNNSYAAAALGAVQGDLILFDGSGGLAGFMSSSESVVRNSYALGPVAGSSSRVGGLVGNNQSVSIIHSYARGAVYSKSSSAGALLGIISGSSSIQNVYGTGAVSGGGTRGGLIGQATGTSITYSGRNLYVDSAGSGNGGIGRLAGTPTATACSVCVNQTDAEIRALALDLDAADDETDNDTDELNGWSTANWVKNANEHPRLLYADDPNTNSETTDINECELLPDYDHETPANCVAGGTFCCGQELPHQRLYGSIANVTFTHDHDGDGGTDEEPVAIGEPTATAPRTGFYYTLSQPAVTVTYNLLTGISVASVALENDDGTPNTDATWTASGATGGSISGIAAGESFWLALTFQEGTGANAVQHKVRRKFVYPASE